MYKFHKGIIDNMCTAWQEEELATWKFSHLFDKFYFEDWKNTLMMKIIAFRIYSDYIQAHAFKLLLLISHGIGGRQKLILWIEIGCGPIHNNPLLILGWTTFLK